MVNIKHKWELRYTRILLFVYTFLKHYIYILYTFYMHIHIYFDVGTLLYITKGFYIFYTFFTFFTYF